MNIRDHLDDQPWLDTLMSQGGMDKTAAPTRGDVLGLDRDKYAGIFVDDGGREHCRYPMDTPENLALSSAYLLYGDNNLSKEASAQVARNLMEGYYGFASAAPDEIVKIAHKGPFQNVFSARTSTDPTAHALLSDALPDSCYAIKTASVRALPVRSAEDARGAISWFNGNWMDVPVMERMKIAHSITNKAAEYGVAPCFEDAVGKYTSGELSPLFKEAMAARAYLAPDYANLYNGLATNPPGNLYNLLEKIAELDTMTGINVHWDDALEDPAATVFNDKYAGANFEDTIDGEVVRGEDLERAVSTKPRAIELVLGATHAAKFVENPVKFYREADRRLKRIIATFVKQVRLDDR